MYYILTVSMFTLPGELLTDAAGINALSLGIKLYGFDLPWVLYIVVVKVITKYLLLLYILI